MHTETLLYTVNMWGNIVVQRRPGHKRCLSNGGMVYGNYMATLFSYIIPLELFCMVRSRRYWSVGNILILTVDTHIKGNSTHTLEQQNLETLVYNAVLYLLFFFFHITTTQDDTTLIPSWFFLMLHALSLFATS